MIKIKTRYIVYNHRGTGVRHHHFDDQNIVYDFTDDDAAENESGSRKAFGPAKYPFGSEGDPDLVFAFMSVNGTRDGNLLFTSPGDFPYHVGTQDIHILTVYVQLGGNGSPFVWVDAFNLDTGAFSDDLHFVSVCTPPQNAVDASRTSEANQEGDIALDASVHLIASATIDGGVPFLEWKQILPVQEILTKPDFDLAATTSSKIWIAFYKSPARSIPDNISLIQWVDLATKVDGHPGNPGFRLGSELKDFAVGVALAKAAGGVDSSIRGELQHIAVKQIEIASQAIQKKIEQEKP